MTVASAQSAQAAHAAAMAVPVALWAAGVCGALLALQVPLRLRKDSRKALAYRLLSGDRGQR